jgi:nucleotide-binding universal stress UspA family protein
MSILAAVDGRPNSRRVVTTGLDLAQAYGTNLHVIHVIKEETAQRRVEERENYYLDTATKDARKVASDVVDDVTDDRTDVTVSGHVGAPVDVILEQASDRDPAYLVLGGRKRSPVGKALIGSVLQKVLLSADYPVVTVMKGDE